MCKRIEHVVSESIATITARDPVFFDKFHPPIVPARAESSTWLQSFIAHLSFHGVDDDTASATVKLIEEEFLPTVSAYNFHWALKYLLRDAYNRDRENPIPGVTYMVADFQAPAVLNCLTFGRS